jgi:hypothetical protein
MLASQKRSSNFCGRQYGPPFQISKYATAGDTNPSDATDNTFLYITSYNQNRKKYNPTTSLTTYATMLIKTAACAEMLPKKLTR